MLLKKFIKYNIALIVTPIVLIFIIAILDVQTSLYIGKSIDTMSDNHVFLRKVLTLLIILALKLIFDKVCLDILEQRLSNNLIIEIKNQLIHKVISVKYSVMMSWNQNDLFQMLSKDIYDIQKISINMAVHFLISVVSAIIAIYELFMISRTFPLVVCCIYLISIISIKPIGKLNKKYEVAVRNCEEEINKSFFQTIRNIVLIKIYGKEEKEIEQIKDKNDKYSSNVVNSKITNNFYRTLARVINAVAPATIVVLGSNRYMKGQITIGQIIAAVGLLSSICTPIQTFGSFVVQIKGMIFKIKRIHTFLSEEDEVIGSTIENKFGGDITIRNLSYKVNNIDILNNISCKIKAGEKTAIVGVSGSGKSTFANIISGLIEPTDGEIIVGDTKMGKEQMTSMRYSLSYIQGNTYVCADTIRNNLLLSGATEKSMQSMCKLFAFDKVTEKLINGYDTVITPQDTKLSGGEYKRLGLVRGMAIDRNYYLLDEVTTGLDKESASSIVDDLTQNFPLKTVILITHDLSKMNLFDNIILFHEGKVIATGKHSDIYEKCKQYRELYNEG